MASWFGRLGLGLGSGLGHSLGRVGGSVASLPAHLSDSTRGVLRKGTPKLPDFPDSGRKETEAIQATGPPEQERPATPARRDTATLQETLEEGDTRLASLQEEGSHLREELEPQRQQRARAAPVVDPNTLDAVTQLESEVSPLEGIEGHLEEETQHPPRTTEEQKQRKALKLGTEKTTPLTERLDEPDEDETGPRTQTIQPQDWESQGLPARLASAASVQDAGGLQQQLQAYALERERVLAVFDEKVRENSQLKRAYHAMMDLLVAKEAELGKLRGENQTRRPRADGGGEDMFREAIRHLSRLVRAKDIEIGALSQKCQTLLTIWQTSDAGHEVRGVDANQLEELLRERDTLKQRVNVLEEWQRLVLTEVHNLQRESSQLQKELPPLEARALVDSEEKSRRQMHPAAPLPRSQGDATQLRLLGKRLAQMQLGLEQLCNAEEVLLGPPDLTSPQPPAASSRTCEAAGSQEAIKSEALGEPSKGPPAEMEALRRATEEKDAAIRSLQEETQRLSEAMAATSELERERQAQTDSEIQRLKEKQEALQNTLEDKELLIEAQREEFLSLREDLTTQASENELLRQAVTNLKERIGHLEADACQVKQENAKLLERSREKDAENQALQETNMRLSVTLREKEFECVSVKKAALAFECLLREKEQGRAGELGQLLNAVTSMQEKSILFQHERDEAALALRQERVENCALREEVRLLRDQEARLGQELGRSRTQASECEDAHLRAARLAGDRAAQLRRKVTALEERLLSSSRAMQKASQRAAARLGSLQEQLTAVTQQKEETALQLSASREAEKQHAGALANLKVVLAEWMQKADGLEGKLRSLQGRLERAQAASRLQEEQIGELQRQDEARQEVLEDVQKKWTDLVSTLEGKADKALLRKLFTDALQSARHERREAFRRMGSTLGVEREAMEQLLQEEQGGLTGWVTGRLGSRSAPDTPRRPSQQSELKSSFSELWVNFLEAESRGASPPRQLPAQPRKRPEAPARKRLAKNVPALLRPALAATPRRSDGNPCSPAVSLIDPPGPGTGGSGHLLLDAVTDVVPRGTPWLLPPAKSAAGLLQGLSKP